MAKSVVSIDNISFIDNKSLRKEKNRLMKIFKDIDKNQLEFVKKTIDNLAYLNLLSEQLRDSISTSGTTIEWNNGKQIGQKENPDVKNLISVQKNIVSINNQLLSLVPKAVSKSKFEEFLDS